MNDKTPAPWVYQYADLMGMFKDKRVIAFELEPDRIDPKWILERGAKDLTIIYINNEVENDFTKPELSESDPLLVISSLGCDIEEVSKKLQEDNSAMQSIYDLVCAAQESDDVMFGSKTEYVDTIVSISKMINYYKPKTYAIKSSTGDVVIWGTESDRKPIAGRDDKMPIDETIH